MMKTFTVHMPPPTGDPEKDALGTVFVREGLAIWALLVPVIWLIVNRMWLVLLAYVALIGLLEVAAALVGDIAPGIVAFLVTILFALEANALKRWTLERKGYRLAGIAAGRTLEDAELRFFDAWTAKPARAPSATGNLAASPPGRPGLSAHDRPRIGERPVTGLFPQPERLR